MNRVFDPGGIVLGLGCMNLSYVKLLDEVRELSELQKPNMKADTLMLMIL